MLTVKRPLNKGLFHGHFTDLDGKKIRRVRRSEYAELYRLHRLCKEVEAATPAPSSAVYRVPQGFVRTSFPGVPTFYPEHKLT